MTQPTNISNVLNLCINGTLRTTLVLVPSMAAASHAIELATRTMNFILKGFGFKAPAPTDISSNTDKKAEPGFVGKSYEWIKPYLPRTVTERGDQFSTINSEGKAVPMHYLDVVKGFACYTVFAIVANFAANKLLGPMPQTYNDAAKYIGSPLRLDTNYDVIQLFINHVRK